MYASGPHLTYDVCSLLAMKSNDIKGSLFSFYMFATINIIFKCLHKYDLYHELLLQVRVSPCTAPPLGVCVFACLYVHTNETARFIILHVQAIIYLNLRGATR